MASAEGLDDRRLTGVDLVFELLAFAVLLAFVEEEDFFVVEWDEGFVVELLSVELLSADWTFFFFWSLGIGAVLSLSDVTLLAVDASAASSEP